MVPIPRFVWRGSNGKYRIWYHPLDEPNYSEMRDIHIDPFPPLSQFHANALSVIGVFGASLAYSSFFQYSTSDTPNPVVLGALRAAYTFFTVVLSLVIWSQISPLGTRPIIRLPIMLFAGCGTLSLHVAISFIVTDAIPLTVVFSPIQAYSTLLFVVLLGFPTWRLSLAMSAFKQLLSYIRCLVCCIPCFNLPFPSGRRLTGTPHISLEMETRAEQETRDSAAFFLASYGFHGGALEYLQSNVPAFSHATLEGRSRRLLDVYQARWPARTGGWEVHNSPQDEHTLCRRFIELEDRWGCLIKEMRSLCPGSLKGTGLYYMPPESAVDLLLCLEKIFKPDESVPSHASPEAPGSGVDGAASPEPSAAHPSEEVVEDGAAATAPSASQVDPQPEPEAAAAPSAARPPIPSSEGMQRPPPSPQPSFHCVRCAADLAAGNAAGGPVSGAEYAGGDLATSSGPSGSDTEVSTQASVHAVTKGSDDLDIAVAASSVVREDDLSPPAPVTSGHPMQAPDAESPRGV